MHASPRLVRGPRHHSVGLPIWGGAPTWRPGEPEQSLLTPTGRDGLPHLGDAAAPAKLADKVKKGGAGVWGQIPMPPNAAVSDGDAKALVEWILAGAK